jgi:hypothetical protein
LVTGRRAKRSTRRGRSRFNHRQRSVDVSRRGLASPCGSDGSHVAGTSSVIAISSPEPRSPSAWSSPGEPAVRLANHEQSPHPHEPTRWGLSGTIGNVTLDVAARKRQPPGRARSLAPAHAARPKLPTRVSLTAGTDIQRRDMNPSLGATVAEHDDLPGESLGVAVRLAPLLRAARGRCVGAATAVR